MILSLAVLLGLSIAVVRYRGEALTRISTLPLRSAWIVLLAIILQIPLLRAPAVYPDQLGVQQALLVLSYGLLLVFVWINRHMIAIWLIGFGLAANLLVILANGGFMPVTPQTLQKINPGSTLQQWQAGVHYPGSKDVIRALSETRLWFLSDFLVVPPPFPLPFAFSPGDILIAAGIIYLLGNLPAIPAA
jgi:hypothetical protein